MAYCKISDLENILNCNQCEEGYFYNGVDACVPCSTDFEFCETCSHLGDTCITCNGDDLIDTYDEFIVKTDGHCWRHHCSVFRQGNDNVEEPD